MNLEELAQPSMPGQKANSLKIQNIKMVIVTNAGDGEQVQLRGVHSQAHALKLQPGDRVHLDLIEPAVVRITKR